MPSIFTPRCTRIAPTSMLPLVGGNSIRLTTLDRKPEPVARSSQLNSSRRGIPICDIVPGMPFCEGLPVTPYGEARSVCESPLASRKLSVMDRSEEHTSELQSHLNLVCRLLLEIKKRKSR